MSFKEKIFKVCPKSGRIRGLNKDFSLYWALFFITGFGSLIWVAIRVLPRPYRAAYPCQQTAIPVAKGFVLTMAGLFVSALSYKRVKAFLSKRRYTIASLSFLVALVIAACSSTILNEDATASTVVPVDTVAMADTVADVTPVDSAIIVDPADTVTIIEPPVYWHPADAANAPVGIAKGTIPGRVVMVHNAAACNWVAGTNYYWSDKNTDVEKVRSMFSTAMCELTGSQTTSQSWDKIFTYHNTTVSGSNKGYTSGEKVAIKVNNNAMRKSYDNANKQIPTPQLVRALVEQLINEVGVAEEDITIFDPSRYFSLSMYAAPEGLSEDYPKLSFEDKKGTHGRISKGVWSSTQVYFSDSSIIDMKLPKTAVEATYLINLGPMRGHRTAGMTVCGKNWMGCIPKPGKLHPTVWNKSKDTFNPLVDLMGHEDLGAKTMLYICDALYAAHDEDGIPAKLSTFGDWWSSSILVSQDQLALESVVLDFLRADPFFEDVLVLNDNIDNFLHEAALAHNPASGTLYNPMNDGVKLKSLGVHEHWNNSISRQYSGNQNIGQGIEFIQIEQQILPIEKH